MNIGIPKEIKEQENRVSITPKKLKNLCILGHQLFVEKDAGKESNYSDEDYQKMGATILNTPEEIFEKSELILKVKEPQESELKLLNEKHILFTYLHLSASKKLTKGIMDSGCTAIAYETINVNGKLPLLEPMSAIAGRMAPLVGSYHLSRPLGGYGILSSGVKNVCPANITILGGGISGVNAAIIASGIQAKVNIFEIDEKRIKQLKEEFKNCPSVDILKSTPEKIEEILSQSHLTIGAVLVAGAVAPKIINENLLSKMPKNAVFVDISVDQGGCSTTTKPTTHQSPTYEKEGVVHYCVANMPGAYPRTATEALIEATHSWLEILANEGLEKACQRKPEIIGGVNCQNGKLHCRPVAEAHNLEFSEFKLN